MMSECQSDGTYQRKECVGSGPDKIMKSCRDSVDCCRCKSKQNVDNM